MKPWMEPFIRPCLARIPDRLYRKRLTAELADHLESLSADLKAEELSVQQAQALALERMGNPEELSRQLYGRWHQHVRSPRYVLGQLALACWMMGLAFLLAFFLLGVAGFTYDAAPGWSMQGNPAVTAAAGGTIFLIPFSFGAFWLARQFQGHPHPRALVFAGLLLAWLGQLCVLRRRRSPRPLVHTDLFDPYFGWLRTAELATSIFEETARFDPVGNFSIHELPSPPPP